MIQKNGHIIAIDSVVHDNTMSGNGTSASPLGVNGNVLKNAGDWITVTGSYANGSFTYKKEAGDGINFNHGAVLSADSVYSVTTDVEFKPSTPNVNWYDMSIKVGDKTHNFSVDGINNGAQTFSFTQIEKCTQNKTLTITPTFDNIGTAKVVQSIHNIISLGGAAPEPTPVPVTYPSIPFVLEDLDAGETSTYNVLYQEED